MKADAMNEITPSYFITGSYKLFIDKPLREKAMKHRYYDVLSRSCARGNSGSMLKFSEMYSVLAKTEGSVFQEAANFWLLRYHLFISDLDQYTKEHPDLRTLIKPDLTGTYRGSTLQFVGISGWTCHEPITITRASDNVLIAEQLINETCDHGGFGWESEYEVSLCDNCLQPIPGTQKHPKAGGAKFDADLKEALKWRGNKLFRDNYPEYEKRIKYMPLMMSNMFNMIGGYLKGKVETSLFVNAYQDAVVPLYKRIACGTDKDAYTKRYLYEIELLHDVSAACDKYQRCGIDNVREEVLSAYDRYMTREIDLSQPFFLM